MPLLEPEIITTFTSSGNYTKPSYSPTVNILLVAGGGGGGGGVGGGGGAGGFTPPNITLNGGNGGSGIVAIRYIFQ